MKERRKKMPAITINWAITKKLSLRPVNGWPDKFLHFMANSLVFYQRIAGHEMLFPSLTGPHILTKGQWVQQLSLKSAVGEGKRLSSPILFTFQAQHSSSLFPLFLCVCAGLRKEKNLGEDRWTLFISSSLFYARSISREQRLRNLLDRA